MSDFPKVSIVITTYLPESKPYLDACVFSCNQLNYPKDKVEIILVGRPGYRPEYAAVRTVIMAIDEYGNSEGMNFGFSHASDDSKHFLYLNDDTILTKNCLKNFVAAAGDQEVILGPISPCDNFDKYHLGFPYFYQGKMINIQDRQYRMNSDHVQAMIDAESIYPHGAIPQNHLFFYAVFIPRIVWNKIGKFAEEFKTGPDDIDYSYRARRADVPLFVCLHSLIWHFSGVTADKTLTKEMREKNSKTFEEKWTSTH